MLLIPKTMKDIRCYTFKLRNFPIVASFMNMYTYSHIYAYNISLCVCVWVFFHTEI